MAPVSIFHQARSYSGMRSLVTVVAIAVTVLETFTVIPAVQLAVTEPRVVVLRSLLIGAKIPKVGLPASPPVIATFLDPFVVSRIQRGLPKVERTTVVAVTIPVAATTILATVVVVVVVAVTVAVEVAIVLRELNPKLGVVSALECPTEVSAIQFAIAET